MPYTLTITADTPADLIAQLEALVLTQDDARAVADAKTNKADDAAREALQKERDEKPKGSGSKAKAKAEPKGETKPAAEEKGEDKADAVALDFDKDVAPKVIQLVADKGRVVTQGILDQYGVARASQIEDDLLPEFLAKVEEALAS